MGPVEEVTFTQPEEPKKAEPVAEEFTFAQPEEPKTVEPVAEELPVKKTEEPKPVAPKFVTKLKDQKVEEGITVTFEVTVTGTPEPNVQWFYNNVVIKEDERHEFKVSNQTFILIVKDVNKADIGKYKVTASNTVKTVTTVCSLEVTEKPKPKFKPKKKEHEPKKEDVKELEPKKEE